MSRMDYTPIAHLVAAATAPCPFPATQEEILAAVGPRYAESIDLDRHRSIFANSGVERRRLVRPVEELIAGRGWLAENHLFVEEGVRLGEIALSAALDRAGLAGEAIDHIFLVTSTGVAAPSLDAHLIGRGLGRPDTRRSPLWGLGCAGGVSALGRAAEWLRGHPGGVAAVVTIEFCSLTYLADDRSLGNFIASALFGDGVAAAVLVGADHPRRGSSLAVHGIRTTLLPDTFEVMGWTPVAEGLQVVFDRKIPALARAHTGDELRALCGTAGIDPERVTAFWGHPGGPKVLDAIAASLDWPRDRFDLPTAVLREEGNMSSATVLSVLSRAAEAGWPLEEGECALVAALGPGFTSEQLLVSRSS